MIDDQRHGNRIHEGAQFIKDIGLEIDYHMPACGQAPADLQELVLGRIVDQPLEEVEPDTAHPAIMQRGQLRFRNIGIDHRHAARLAVGFGDCVQSRGIVRAVAGGLHDHILFEAEMIAQRKQLVRPGIGGKVLRFGAEAEGIHRPEDMAMRIHRTRRRGKIRLAGVGVP